MSEIRQDPVTGTWVVLSPERAGRPQDYARDAAEAGSEESCPLCPGHEHMTPPELFRIPGPDGASSWVTRVVPNKFPFLSAPDESMGAEDVISPWPYRGMTGFGSHEVIVETPDHFAALADYSRAQMRAVVDTVIARMTYWRDDGRSAHALAFRNWGKASGSSLAHPHMQFTTLPRVPETVAREVGNYLAFAEDGRGCLMCEVQKVDDREGRTVYDDGLTLVQSPWAATVAYALRVSPRPCRTTLIGLPDDERDSLAAAFVTSERALREVFGAVPAYNMVFHIAPYAIERAGAGMPFHWHVDILPRNATQAGFEWGSGMYTNLVDPDHAALALRAKVDALLSAREA